MGIGASILLLAVGAVLTFAITVSDATVGSTTVDWDTVGVILMILGAIGLIWSFMVMSAWRDRRRGGVVERPVDTVVERDTYVGP
ncbi:MAG: hypothetical protein JWM98_1521 [Thermoleophilia bacterium]|nr:hypothetical protein [Thermoleophilia bacterium]